MSTPTTRRAGAPWITVATAVLALLGACTDEGASPIAAPEDAPLLSRGDREQQGRRIPDQYVVVLRPDAQDVRGFARTMARAPRDSVMFVYESALKGFAARLAPSSVGALRQHPLVQQITEDEYGTADQAAWGLDRSDQRDLPLNGQFAPVADGSGVNLYIVDSGVRKSHAEFDYGVRARHAYTVVNDGRGSEDCSGHGTHVAAIAAGSTYGMARRAMVHAVRIADCNGAATVSGAIAAIDWLRANHDKPAVANLSYTWSARSDLDAAVSSLIDAGVPVVTSAGNNNADACNYSPKRVANIISVGNSDDSDTRAFNSNWGSCVHLFAPGSAITSAWHSGDTDTRSLSGTSMSAPHVAGVVALYLQSDPTAPSWKARDAVLNSATVGKVQDAQGTPNRLVYAIPVYFSVSVDGTNSIVAPGSYTWTALTTGGNGSYTYQWSLQNHRHGYEQTLGTERTQTVAVYPGDGDFTITVIATSAGQTHRASMYVLNSSGGGCDPSTFGCTFASSDGGFGSVE
ncbi:MAG TPA: S8 family serine peptidase [Longimicrobiaceae bacterium]|nr:S8 family serine peptidase [Longimicrobiaceae bacterium]